MPIYAKEELIKLIDNGNCRGDVLKELRERKKEVEEWPEELREYVLSKL